MVWRIIHRVNPGISFECVDLGVNRIEEIMAKTLFFGFVEPKAFGQIVFRWIENYYIHETRSLISFLAVSQSV